MHSTTKVLLIVSTASFVAFANYNMIIIALPAILSGLNFDPNSPDALPYIVWLIVGYMTVTASFLSFFGRMGDVYRKVRVFRLGFLVFALSSLAMAALPPLGKSAVVAMIALRLVQGVGGGLLMANGAAIVADLVPRERLGYAISVTQSVGLVGGVMGLVLGGVLSYFDWRLIFLFSATGAFAGLYLVKGLRAYAEKVSGSLDLLGGAILAVSLSLVLLGFTLFLIPGLSDYSPWLVVSGIIIGLFLPSIERRAKSPMFVFSLFKVWDFSIAMLANSLVSAVRQGLTVIIIVMLQAVWLPLHGVSFDQTPLLAGLYMLPNSLGFAVSAPFSGRLSDRIGSKVLTTLGLAITALSTLALYFLPYDFQLWQFFVITFFSGLGMGMFSAPNMADIMAAAPPNYRGAASGMRGTFQNTASAIAVAVYFTMLFAFLTAPLLQAEQNYGVEQAIPAPAVIFSVLLGYNPFPGVQMTPQVFGQLVAQPFMEAFRQVALVSFVVIALMVPMSYMRKGKRATIETRVEKDEKRELKVHKT